MASIALAYSAVPRGSQKSIPSGAPRAPPASLKKIHMAIAGSS